MDGRYGRLMSELAALCSDRSNVITAESLQFFATSGRAEPVKLERAPERSDAQQKQTNSKQDDLLGADAARRQRVEELTRFFMEAKSDIEFALGGGRDFHEAKDKEKDEESERDEDKENTEVEDDVQDDSEDPDKRLAKLHYRLLKDKLDKKVYNVMLGPIREQDPALYGAILCHPLVTGVDPKKDKKKKKKRKDRDRKDKQSSQTNIGAGMLIPDLMAEALTDEQMKTNICRFVARSVADGSLQALMLAAKLVLSFLNQQIKTNKTVPPDFCIASHLRVLRGEKAPEYKTKKAAVSATSVKKEAMTPTKSKQTVTEASGLDSAGENYETDLQSNVVDAASSAEIDLDSDSGSIAKLRARLSRFGGDREDADADEDDVEERRESVDNVGGECADEDALMARAIALSLSPEVNLRDQNATDDASATPRSETKPDGATIQQNEPSVVKIRPPSFSAEEMLELGPFALPSDLVNDVDGVTVVVALIAQMTKVCMEYLKSCHLGILPNKSPVQPHPLTFMLLNSLLRDLHTSVTLHSGWTLDPFWTAKWRLFSSCSMLSLFRVLEVNFFHVEVMGIAPASVGLGQIPKSSSQQYDGKLEGGNPLLESLKSLISNYVTAENPFQLEKDDDVIGTITFASPESCSPADIQSAAVFYSSQIREQAMAAWVRAFAIFYEHQTERHSILASKLVECLRLARDGKKNVEWKFYELDLLCARLALPDMAQFFVPPCVDIIEHDDKIERTQKNDGGCDSILKHIDDGVLLNAASKTGKIKAKWNPAVIRASLDSESLSARCLYDYISGHGPPGLLGTELESPGGGPSDNALNADTLANAYACMWDLGRKQKAEALECINRLPSLVDLLRDSILSAGWHDFDFKDSYKLVHAPLLPLLEKEDTSRPQALNCRIVLLRSLQDLMIQRLGGYRGDEPPALEFDFSRCAETMTLSDGNRTAKQYTAKQWGMVMATTGCPPNTGTHEWGVRLDRCEKGHIFLGVCTRDASVATYVGGDRQGWGLIGTRALWHARSKVRGDYGDGFTTGSIVRVRLNTDSGALSFGVGDSDWGIAFDGLTQHGTLYPAIGLYQRDDQVTILPVQPSVGSSFATSLESDSIKHLGVAIPAILKPFLHHVGALLESCCSFLSSSALDDLNLASDQQSSLTSDKKIEYARECERLLSSHPLLFSMVTPLISSLSLIRSYHGLCSTLAITLMPWCMRAVQSIERVIQVLRALRDSNDDMYPGDIVLSVAGEWELKSMAAGNIPAQQYHLTLSQGKDGSMQGRSSGSFTTVTLNGIARGTKVSFVETWRQGGTCLVEGRLRADGAVFTGSYEDTKSHTSGCIVGNKILPDVKETDDCQKVSNRLITLEMVIANLVGYFGHALISLESDDMLVTNVATSVLSPNEAAEREKDESDDWELSRYSSSECSFDEYDEWVSSSLLEGGLPLDNVQTHLKTVLDKCADISGMKSATVDRLLPELTKATRNWMLFVLPMTLSVPVPNVDSTSVGGACRNSFCLKELIENRGEAATLDRWVSKHVGESPFVRLGGEPMKATRRTVCAAMIWHSGSLNSIKKYVDNTQNVFAESEIRPHDNLMHIWRAAQRVIEWAIRAKNSMGSSYAVVAGLVIRKAQFLLKIEPSTKVLAAAEAVFALTTGEIGAQRISSKAAVYECAERIFNDTLVQVARFVEAPIRVSVLQSRMLESCSAAFLRTIGMLSFRYFVGDSGNHHRGDLSPERHEVIQSSFALSSALQWLTPTLADPKTNGGRGTPLGKDFGDFSPCIMPAPSASAQTNVMESSYYLSGIGGCGKHLKNDLRTSFESLYGYLSASLSKATWAHDTDLQLVILLAWGIIIQPDDHSFLSRVGIFRVLQTVLDEARGSGDTTSLDSPAGLSCASSGDSALVAENKKRVVQAALKVVHLLAAQVAHASDTADGLLSASDVPSSCGLRLGSIPLLRKPSGPETLGKSVFHMLYTEVKNSLEDMRQNRGKMTIDASSIAFVNDPAQSDDSSTSRLRANPGISIYDAQEYCYQICSLLYSVSGSPVCRSHLSSSRWLRLLLALVDVNSPQIQRRILKLLRRLLPSLDPSSIRVRYDEVESFDMESDDELDAEEPDHASTLIDFFVGIVGLNSPPSVAKVLLNQLANSSTSKSDKPTKLAAYSGYNGEGLAAEVVLLLRSLYESKKWAVYLNRAISDALASIPLLCVTEQDRGVADTADSDVEMEDISKEIPSLEIWSAQIKNYERALSALCILDGHIEGLHVGGTVKIMPRSGSSLQEISFRGAKGVVVAYEPEKSAAEVLLRENRTDEINSQQQSLLSTRSVPMRPVRVPINDLFVVPEVELPTAAFSDEVLHSLLVSRFSYFLVEVGKSLREVSIVDALSGDNDGGGNDGDSEDEDDMSNDGSSSPSAMDSEMPSGAGVDESDSEANESPCQQNHGITSTSPTEPTDILAEMEKESRLYRMLLCQHGLRASATLLKSESCAAVFIRGVGPKGLKDLLAVAVSETPTTAGAGDIASLEESWLMLWSRWYATRSALAAPSPLSYSFKGKNKTSDALNVIHSSGPIVQQMMEMGFPKEWCDVALARCSQNVEAAINFCFEHSSDMERLVAEYRSSRSSKDSSSKSSRKDDFEAISPLLEQLSEMGFPFNWCKKALAANRNNVDAALTWILSNGEVLEAEDRRDEENKLRASGEDDTEGFASRESTIMPVSEDCVFMPNPLRAVSGQACIGEHDLMVEGLVGGGFASVGAPDCLVSSGRWYYEAILHTNGCIQIGWADVAFCGAADRGDGVGDGAHSWAYDGWRQQRWHGRSSQWGSKWKQGDVIGCGIDADAGTVIFSLNGKMRSANMGVAFRAIEFARGVYPCASFNRRERLQFNLGGTPFRHLPPPGFQPILNVLSNTHDLSSVPKGFSVIGSREDCLEESMGEENYSSDTRYFARDMHPSMLRSTGHSRSNGFVPGPGMTKADALAEIKTLPDNRVYLELLVVTRSLAILQARRALLTILARWPTSLVGSFSLGTCLSGGSISTEREDSARFIEFVKLIASLSAIHVPNALSSTSLSLPDGDAFHLLNCGATGRSTLSLLSGVMLSALNNAFSSISSGTGNYNPLVDTILSCTYSEVRRASQRQYARIPWNSSEAAITTTLLQITAEASQTWSDKKILNHPNLFLAEWLSGLLLESLEMHKERLSAPVHDQIRQQLLQAWISALKSPSICVKERCATILGGILQDILPKTCGITNANNFEGIDDETKVRLRVALDALPLQRLVDLSQERILREYPNAPVCSKYVQSLVELVSAAGLVLSAVGQSTDKLFESSMSLQLQACKKIEADLEPIDKMEYEEVKAAKKLMEVQQAQQAAEKALKLENVVAEQAAAVDVGVNRISSSSIDQMDTSASNGDDANQGARNDTNVAENAGVTNMEVDNSDSEEAPDITLSTIANMATEDSAAMVATAAIAPASGYRLDIKGLGRRTNLPMPELVYENADTTFDFRLPDKDPVYDTSMLNSEEIGVFEAAKRGIMGEEPRGWKHGNSVGVLADSHTQLWSGCLTQFRLRQKQEEASPTELKVGCKVIRGPNWKWRDQDGGEGSVGVVEGVSPWSGVEGEGMSVRWPNDSLYTYRWGADGNFDLIHVEVDEDGNINYQYPTPKAKQEDEGSFGSELHLGVLLYLSVEDNESSGKTSADVVKLAGLMEWPDYGAAVRVVGMRYADGSLCIQELQLARGDPDMGWMLRFGTEKWQPGTKYMLYPLKARDSVDEPSTDDTFKVDTFRGEYTHTGMRGGELVEIRGELQVSTKYLFTMDHHNHFSTLGISSDGLSVTCHSGESRNLALGTVGFTTGVHYWEVHVEQAEFGSVFIGVCEKAGPPGSQAALSSRLNRWHGWGFVNFRATYHNSTERIYGDHFNASDTIGVRLDMEQGKLSFFMDGIKFGEHIVSDLGIAFENIKGERNSRTLYPCIGMRKGGDRVTLNQKWVSMPGVSPSLILSDAVDVSKSLHSWFVANQLDKETANAGLSDSGPATDRTEATMLSTPSNVSNQVKLPDTLLRESWLEWKRWIENHWQRCHVRPRGISVDFDTSPAACIRVSNAAGLSAPFLAGDRVRMCSKCGQELNQPEEAVVLGVYRDFLWYRTETQGNEGADEGRAWAWYWSPNELVEILLIRRAGKDMTHIENSAMDISEHEDSPEHRPFKPRSILEERALTNFDAFVELATQAHSTSSDMQLVERLNAYCAAIGLDVTNLKITDVETPAEMGKNEDCISANRGSSRARSLMMDDYFSSPALKSITGPELRARTAVLKVLNYKILRVLPYIAIQPDDGSTTQPIDVAGSTTKSTTEFLSTSLKLRSLRRLIFTSTKRAFWDDVLRATTTSTPLPSDEYEDPREIRIIRINRIQAQASKLSLLSQPGDRLRRSVFGQLYRELRAWSDSFFRRAYCGKGHGGQRRAFKVKFLGEGVNDYGGPYRAVFEQIVDELQMDNVELAKGEQGLLPLLIPCPNRRSATGINQDKFLLNPSCGTALLANGPMALELHRFLGKLIGTAVRHGLQMGLDLPSLVWRPLAGLEVSRAHLEGVDMAATNNLTRVENLSTDTETAAQEADEVLGYLAFSTTLSDGVEVSLIPHGEKVPVTLANRELYVRLVEKTRLTESSQQLAAVKDGLASVLPMELAPLFTPRELEVLICGRREVDVDLLHQCTEYSEGADESMPHVQHFWEVLREMTSEERTSFLRFVWARSRMPNSAKDFPMNFKLQTAQDPGASSQPDLYLPHAQTCFFALRLPAYTSKEVLRSKLLYAIQNSPNMDADVRLHNAEGWADA